MLRPLGVVFDSPVIDAFLLNAVVIAFLSGLYWNTCLVSDLFIELVVTLVLW